MPHTVRPTACIALSDGSVFYGHGFGALGEVVALVRARLKA